MAEKLYEGAPERVVINTGPSFGQVVKLVLFGAAVGYGAAQYLQKKQKPTRPGFARRAASQAGKTRETLDTTADRIEEGIEAAGETVEEKLKSLAGRIRDVSGRAKDVFDQASETVRPVFDQAVAEGKRAAAETQARLKGDIDQAGNEPYFAEMDERGEPVAGKIDHPTYKVVDTPEGAALVARENQTDEKRS